MTKSDEWDKREKAMMHPLDDLPPRAKETLMRAMRIYYRHRKENCERVEVTIDKLEKITELRCTDCGWDYFKERKNEKSA